MRVAICRDDAEAALVRAVLTAHDVPVHINGEHHAAMVGLGAAIVRLDVLVAREHAEEAAALIAELREGGEAALADGEIPADDASERADEVAPGGALVQTGEDTLTRLGRHRRIAGALLVGLTLMHGAAHMSTRAWKRGLGLAALQVTGWRHLFAGHATLGGTLVLGAIGLDLVGAIVEIVRRRAPVPPARALGRPR